MRRLLIILGSVAVAAMASWACLSSATYQDRYSDLFFDPGDHRIEYGCPIPFLIESHRSVKSGTGAFSTVVEQSWSWSGICVDSTLLVGSVILGEYVIYRLTRMRTFSLRQMFIAIALIAGVCAWARHNHSQTDAEEQTLFRLFPATVLKQQDSSHLPWAFGKWIFGWKEPVIELSIRGIKGIELTDEWLSDIESLKQLECIRLHNFSISKASWERLHRHPTVKAIYCTDCKVEAKAERTP